MSSAAEALAGEKCCRGIGRSALLQRHWQVSTRRMEGTGRQTACLSSSLRCSFHSQFMHRLSNSSPCLSMCLSSCVGLPIELSGFPICLPALCSPVVCRTLLFLLAYSMPCSIMPCHAKPHRARLHPSSDGCAEPGS